MSLDISNLSSLTSLNCSANQIASFNISGATSLMDLNCSSNQITSLDLTGFTNLTNLDCSYNLITSISVNALTNLVSLNCSLNQITSLTVNNLTNLAKLNCYNNQITILDINTLTGLTNLDVGYNSLTSLDVTGLTALEELRFNYNDITSINLSGLVNLLVLDASQNEISGLNLTGLNNLTDLFCWNNQLTSLDVNSFTNLINLSCGGNQLTSLNVSALTNLQSLSCPFAALTSIDVSTLINLTSLNLMQNSLTNLDLSNNNGLTTLDVTNMTGLQSLICGNNAIPNVNFSGLTQLYEVFVDSTGRTSIDVSNQPLLRTLYCGNNPISVVDVSNATQMDMLSVGGSNLTQLFMKNGADEFLSISGGCPNLQVVCADAEQLQQVYSEVMSGGGSGASITSYCTFTPGGNYNTITGLSRFDLNNNGCDALDVPSNNLKFNVFDGTVNEASLVNPSAEYAFYTGAGNFTLTPQLENPAYFNITPASATINFPTLDNSTQTQDFCLTANGVHPDLEVVLTPIWGARPGFDALYQVVYKNKGNQTLSGTVNVVFDDLRTDFVNALPTVNSQTVNSLIWNYLDLEPFESRVINFTLNVNTPLESPAVNDGDILNFTASINFASGDETPADNVSVLNQVVVNSFDPNAKTCLEGNVVSPQEIGNYLHYNIEFENLGTAEAINVVVKDLIDTTKFDIGSLQVLYSSHAMRANIRENVVEFIFENINLAPATGNPPVGGHGNVLFKIKTLPTLNTGDQVENKADIHFDYNAPIETNVARTTFQMLGNPDFNTDQSIVMYPNPAKNQVNINCDSQIDTIELFDIQGRLLHTAIVNSASATLDISNQSNGIYFVRITSEDGMKTEKLVKE
jgi:Leucine-rich repeat (LRR) protein